MNILFDHQIFSRQTSGGIKRYFIELASAMQGVEGTQIRIETVPGGGAGEESQQGLALWAKNELWLRTLGKGRAAPSDVHHATYHLSSRKVGKALVVTHHDCTFERFPELFRGVWIHRKLRARQYALADRIITISDASLADLQYFYEVDPAKLTRIHHGVRRLSEGRQDPLPKEIAGRAYFLYLGGRPAYKNFEGLARAFAQTSLTGDSLLVAAGGGAFRPEELALFKKLGITDRVIVFPQVGDPLLNALYANAAWFVYPSMYEGFGFPPLEAMLANCPVLASNASSIPEICREAAIYFDPREIESIADALDRAFGDQALREACVRRGREVAASYTWERCARETLDLYRQCL